MTTTSEETGKPPLTYKLGEVCEWSRHQSIVYRYVDIFISNVNSTDRIINHQVIQLPEEDARKLVNKMSC